MKLSIIIVNYNVEHFLDQCLHSVFKAIKGLEAEVFVVDNNSVDGSMKMVAEKYPEAICIENKENTGFSVANNQAIRVSKGKYVLLLNPDTVVEEDTFTKTVAFMDVHPKAGGLGIKMIDGTGNYLPESKRGIPTPWVALCKMTGLTRIFSKSKRFAGYYMGHLSNQENNKVDILAGAFMLMRKEALDKVGFLDENFFMYGEDIDLSYRILKGGYDNYYFADSQIIHYKGESTKKGSLNYVYIFYKAMVIFAKKHFSEKNAGLFSFFINAAIYARASIALINRFIKATYLAFLDAGVLFGGLYYIKEYWENNHRFIEGGEYPPELIQYAFPSYIAMWITGVFLNNGYLKPTKAKNIIYGIAYSTLFILALYGLLPESMRFSRAIILLGALWAFVSLPAYRLMLQKLVKFPLFASADKGKRVLLVGSKSEVSRVQSIIHSTGVQPSFTKTLNNIEEATIKAIKEVVQVFNIDEVIFCAQDLSSQTIIDNMALLKDEKVEIKIAPPESLFVIGSNSIHTQGEVYSVEVNQISKAHNKRNKRLFDFFTSLFILLLFPISILLARSVKILSAGLEVLIGKKSWVGYGNTHSYEKLPQIKPGVFAPFMLHKNIQIDDQTKGQLDFLYARDYDVYTDVNIFLKCFTKIGNR